MGAGTEQPTKTDEMLQKGVSEKGEGKTEDLSSYPFIMLLLSSRYLIDFVPNQQVWR